MSEQPPRPESQEFSEEERALIERMRENGPGTRKAFLDWCAGEEKRADIITESGENARARIRHDLKKGKVLMEGGFLDEAWLCFRAAQWAAASETEAAGADLRKEAAELVQYMIDEGYEPAVDIDGAEEKKEYKQTSE